jgi:hypothetical protein
MTSAERLLLQELLSIILNVEQLALMQELVIANHMLTLLLHVLCTLFLARHQLLEVQQEKKCGQKHRVAIGLFQHRSTLVASAVLNLMLPSMEVQMYTLMHQATSKTATTGVKKILSVKSLH